jgi:hypothetical protein
MKGKFGQPQRNRYAAREVAEKGVFRGHNTQAAAWVWTQFGGGADVTATLLLL